MKLPNKPTLGMMLATQLLISSVFAATAKEEFTDGNISEAKILFEKMPETAETNFYLGRIALQQKDLDSAEEFLEEAVEAKPNNVEYNYWFANLSFRQAANASIFSAPGYVSDGKKYHFKALELDPNYIPSMQSLIGFYLNAPAIVGGSTKKAQEMAQRIVKLDGELGLSTQIDIYRSQKEQEKELLLAKKLATEYSKSSKALLKAGFVFQNAKQYETALNYFELASTLKSEDEISTAAALYQIGRTAVFSKSFTDKGIKALEAYRLTDAKIVDNSSLPSINWATFRLATLYASTGNNTKAKSLVILALENNQDKNLKKSAKKFLKKL